MSQGLLPSAPSARARGVIRIPQPGTRSLWFAYLIVPAMCVIVLVQARLGDSDNLRCAALLAFSTVLSAAYCSRPLAFSRFPLSTLTILGFNFVTQSMPIVAQTLFLNPFTITFAEPWETAKAIFWIQIALVAAHLLYSSWRPLARIPQAFANKILLPSWFFRMPTEAELWLMGIAGMLATWISRVIFVSDVAYGDIGGKFLQGLLLFIAMPYFIVFRGYFLTQRVKVSVVSLGGLAIWSVAVLVTAMALNQRSVFAFIGLTVILSVLIALGLGRLRLSGRAKAWLLLAFIATLPMLSAGEDMSLAIALAREGRNKESAGNMIAQTIAIYGDKARLARAREGFDLNLESSLNYSDNYIASTFLNRLQYIKYTDLTMAISVRFGESQRHYLRDEFLTGLKAIFPTPVAKALGIHVDKLDQQYSQGDVYEYLASGRRLGSFLTGSSVTNAFDLFRGAAPLVYGLIAIMIFVTVDMFSVRSARGVLISPAAFMFIFVWFSRTTIDDSMVGLVSRVMRATIQNAVTYFLMFGGARLLVAATRTGSPTMRQAMAVRRHGA